MRVTRSTKYVFNAAVIFETFAVNRRTELVIIQTMTEDTQLNPITPEFIERMVDKVIDRINNKLDSLDMSIDYVAAALFDTTGHDVKVRQRAYGRGSLRATSDPRSPRTSVDAD